MRWLHENPSGGLVNQLEAIFADIKKVSQKPVAKLAAMLPQNHRGRRNPARAMTFIYGAALLNVLRMARNLAPEFDLDGLLDVREDSQREKQGSDPFDPLAVLLSLRDRYLDWARTQQPLETDWLLYWLFTQGVNASLSTEEETFGNHHEAFAVLKDDDRLLFKAFSAYALRDATLGSTPPKREPRAGDPMASLPRTRQIKNILSVATPLAVQYAKQWAAATGMKSAQQLAWEAAELVARLDDGITVHRLVQSDALMREGLVLQHCIGSYAAAAQDKPSTGWPDKLIFSFRINGKQWFTADYNAVLCRGDASSEARLTGWALNDARAFANKAVLHENTNERRALCAFVEMQNTSKNAQHTYGEPLGPVLPQPTSWSKDVCAEILRKWFPDENFYWFVRESKAVHQDPKRTPDALVLMTETLLDPVTMRPMRGDQTEAAKGGDVHLVMECRWEPCDPLMVQCDVFVYQYEKLFITGRRVLYHIGSSAALVALVDKAIEMRDAVEPAEIADTLRRQGK